jgi:basic membrane protein A
MSAKARFMFLLLSVLMAAALLLTACAPAAEEPVVEEPAAEEPLKPKVLLITGTGGLGDQGFNDAGYAGAVRAEQELGVTLDLVEPVEIAELEPQYRSAASSGEYLIIIGLGFYQGDAANVVAVDFPGQKFAIVDSSSTQPNVLGVLFREQENAFLAGILAGLVTTQTDLEGINEDSTLGIVLGIDVPHVRRYAVSFEAGARTVNPNATVEVGVVGDFVDQAKGKELALAQIEKGADIVYQVAGGAGLGVFDAAGERGVYAIGEGLNQNPMHPEFIIASTYKLMDNAVYNAIKAALEGTFQGGDAFYGFSEGYLVVSLEGSNVAVSEEAKAALAEYQAKLASGEIVAPFSQEDLEAYLATLE